VEALYITTNISENVYHNLEIVKIIHQQKENLDKFWSTLLVIAGSWVEALYITTNISENVYHNLEIVKIIHQQKETLDKFWSILEENQNGEYINEIMNELKPVKDIYDKIDQSLSEKDVIAITQEISRIREIFIS